MNMENRIGNVERIALEASERRNVAKDRALEDEQERAFKEDPEAHELALECLTAALDELQEGSITAERTEKVEQAHARLLEKAAGSETRIIRMLIGHRDLAELIYKMNDLEFARKKTSAEAKGAR